MFLADVSGPARVVCSPVEYSLGVGLEVSTKKNRSTEINFTHWPRPLRYCVLESFEKSD